VLAVLVRCILLRVTIVLAALIGYVFGSLPSTWLIATLTGHAGALDGVRRNVGERDAHLLLKQHAGRIASTAAAMDVLKGFTPLVLAVSLADPHEIAACAVGAVCGHCWPPVKYRFAGRGLATAAGTFLAFLPVEMVIAGVIRVVGGLVNAGGLLSTVGFVAVPLVALYRGQPVPYVVASTAINVLIFVRRLEGIEDDVRVGEPVVRAVWRRVVFDASAPGPRPVR
jgi:glycerol-3-phosphate acyltransferase PlsY